LVSPINELLRFRKKLDILRFLQRLSGFLAHKGLRIPIADPSSALINVHRLYSSTGIGLTKFLSALRHE